MEIIDYKTEFESAVNDIIERTKAGKLSLPARTLKITALCENYERDRMTENERRAAQGMRPVGVKPDGLQLQRLASCLLHETLTDKSVNKMQREEYPIMSDTQYHRRIFGGKRTKYGDKLREVPLTSAVRYGNNGRDYGKQDAIDAEIAKFDKSPLSQNKERQREYRQFTKRQPVKKYPLAELQGADA